MSVDPKEKARLEKLRKSQLSARDPGESKIKGYDWSQHNKRSKDIAKKRERPLIYELYDLMPGRWKGALFGALFGLVIGLFLMVVVLAPDLRVLGIVPVVIGGVVGMVIGKTMQEEIK